MILQALYDLYRRLAADPENGLPKAGYSLQNVTFRVVIKQDGMLAGIQDARKEEVETTKSGKERRALRPISILVPGQAKPSGSGLNPCFLWDNTTYMLGYKQDDAKPERTVAAFQAFRERHLSLEEAINCSSFSAVCRFLENWDPKSAVDYPVLNELTSGFGVFQISGQTKYVHEDEAVCSWWARQSHTQGDAATTGICLITGESRPLAQLHDPAIKGVAGAQSMGAKLVSFNLGAFVSFQKEQGLNSPVSEEAAFAYCNALNFLLASKGRRFRIGDATTVFWTDQPSFAEAILPWMMDGHGNAEDDETKAKVQAVLHKIAQGQLGEDDLGAPKTRYYILGLSPNASRLSVRFWHTGSLGELANNLKRHFEHLRLIRQWDETNSKNPEPLVPSAYQLLRQTARDADGIPPLLAGALMRAILLQTRYPDSLVKAVMNRVRTMERKQQGEGSVDNVSYLRASILKAWLIRNHQQSITTMLDETNTNTGYRLGRFFALLEKTQYEAQPDINATIRERYYASASATPRAVFGRLLRTYPHHLAKLETGAKKAREKQAQEILSEVSDFPAHLSLQDQAQFALGYYHQRKDFYTKKPAPADELGSTANA